MTFINHYLSLDDILPFRCKNVQISSYVTRAYVIKCSQIKRIFANKSAAADKSLISIILKRQDLVVLKVFVFAFRLLEALNAFHLFIC